MADRFLGPENAIWRFMDPGRQKTSAQDAALKLAGLTEKVRWSCLWWLAFLWFLTPVLYQYLTIQLAWHDTGHVLHMILNVFDYGFFYSPDELIDHSSEHFTPFWFLLALPLRGFGLIAFLLMGCAAVAATAVAVYAITAKVTEKPLVAALTFAAVLFNPYMQGVNLYPHYEIYGVMFLVLYAYLALNKHLVAASVCFFLALTVKEDFWIYATVVPIVIWNRPRARFLLTCSAGALAYKILVLGLVWDYFYPIKHALITDVWGYPADSEIGIVWYLIKQIHISLPKVFTNHGFDFLITFLFLPLVTPWRFALIAGVLFIWVNATAIDRYSLSYYYSYPALTLMLISLPYAFNRTQTLWRYFAKGRGAKIDIRPYLAGLLLAANLYYLARPPEGLKRGPHLQRVFSAALARRDFKLLEIIRKHLGNDEFSAFAQFPVATYLPHRKNLLVSYVWSRKLFSREVRPVYVLLDRNRWDTDESGVKIPDMVASFQNDNQYEVIEEYDGIYLFKRRSAPTELDR